MRFDIPIYLQNVHPGAYNTETGNREQETVTETKLYASVTNAGTETLNLVYGELRQGCLTVRVQSHYAACTAAFDRIRIGDKVYRVAFRRHLRNFDVYVISGVQ